jgi:hypothetical protein
VSAVSFIPRGVIKTECATWPFDQEEQPDDFEALIRQRITRVASAEKGTKMRVLYGIVVEEQDGMTQDAERAKMIISDCVDNRWTVLLLSGERQQGPLAELSELFGGRRAIVRAARASGLLPGAAKDWLWYIAMVSIALLLGVASALVTHLAAHAGVITGAAVGAAIAAGLLGAIGAAAKSGGGAIPVFGHPAIKHLEAAVSADPAKTDAEYRFLKELVRELMEQRSPLRARNKDRANRAVVIDNFSSLQPRTLLLVREYIRTLPEDIFGPNREWPEEFWVIFDKDGPPQHEGSQRSTGEISRLINNSGSFLAWSCRQQLLDSTRKRTLLRGLERGPLDHADRRLRYRRIGSIVSGAKDEGTEQDLQAQLKAAGDDAAVLAFSFLAMAATVPSSELLRSADIVKTVADRDGASPNPLRELLGAWFTETDRLGAIGDAIKNGASTFRHLFEDRTKRERHRGVRVDAGYADAFDRVYGSIRKEHSLPPADVAHAFWALYWWTRLADSSAWSARAVERMVSHLRALREPSSIADRYGNDVARALCEAALYGAHAALALCVSGIVANDWSDDERDGLIDCALALVPDGDDPQDTSLRASLYDCSWALYMLTGYRGLLGALVAIADRNPEPQKREPLLILYLESIARDDRDDILPPLPDRDTPSCEAIRDHARVRSLWLLALLEPLAKRGESSWPAEIIASSESAIAEIIERAVARTAARREDLIDSLDFATLMVAGMWATLKQTHDEPGGDSRIEVFSQVGDALRVALEARRNPIARPDFVLNGLLEVLSAILLRAPNDIADLYVMWRSLELNELADLSGLCCNVYAAADPALNFDDDARLLVGVGGAEDRPANLVGSEMLAGASRLHTRPASGVALIAEASSFAIDAKLGDGLTFELARMIIEQSLAFKYDKLEKLLDRALDPPPQHRGMLDVPDSEIRPRLLSLLNCLVDGEGSVAVTLRAAVKDRRATIHDPWINDGIDQGLEYSDTGLFGAPADDAKLLALLTRWRTRIWEPGLPPAVAEEGEIPAAPIKTALPLTNASASGDADTEVVYDFPDGRRPPLSTAQHAAFQADARYTYSFVLTRVWRAVDRADRAVLNEAIRLLSDEVPTTRAGIVMLAYNVSNKLAQISETASPEFARAITIQRDGIATAQGEMRPDANRAIYAHLVEHDPAGKASHEELRDLWDLEDHRVAQEQLFLQMEGRHYFEIFWYHYLRPHAPFNFDRSAVESTYETLPSVVPEPLLYDRSGKPLEISGEFLRLGREVFRHNPEREGAAALRDEISKQARRNVHPLYELLMEQDTVSPAVRRLYQQQLSRFDEIDS